MRIKHQRLSTFKPRKRKKRVRPTSANPNPCYYGVKYPRKTLDDMTPEQAVECWFDFPSFCYHFLKIWSKPDADGRRHLIPLHWNLSQREFWPQRSRRNFHLKSRQVGWTTIEQAEDLHIAVTVPGSSVQLLAHSEELTDDMRERVHTFLKNLPERFQVNVARDSKVGFKFDSVPGIGLTLDSRLGLMTVSGKHKGIGKTLDKLHCTEVARWEDVAGGVDSFLATAVQALPASVPVTLETTPNGLGHPSYALWRKAVKGEWGFKPIFMPWWFDETAVRPVPEDFAPRDADEQQLLSRGASPANLVFRREKILEMATPRFSGKTMFDQEYPSDPKSCFISGGKNAFSAPRLVEQENTLEAELVKWEVAGSRWPRVGTVILNPGAEKPHFSEQPGKPLTIWEPPMAGCLYAIGADVGKGIPTGDFSTACVLRSDTMEQVAEYEARVIPKFFARELLLLGRFYNHALIAPERNNEGYTVTSEIYATDYPNLFMAQSTRKGFAEDVFSYGWHNNENTRGMAISQAADVIWERGIRIRSPRLLEQLAGFVEDTHGKYQAPKGMHDDLAWAFIIALWALNHGIYEPTHPCAPGDTESTLEEIVRCNQRMEAGEDVWGDDLHSDVQFLLR